jgi:hypothetical protein
MTDSNCWIERQVADTQDRLSHNSYEHRCAAFLVEPKYLCSHGDEEAMMTDVA